MRAITVITVPMRFKRSDDGLQDLGSLLNKEGGTARLVTSWYRQSSVRVQV